MQFVCKYISSGLWALLSLITSFVVPITIWFWRAYSSARQPFVMFYHPFLLYSRMRKMFYWHLRQLTKFAITYHKIFCWLVVFPPFLYKKCSLGRSINSDGLFSSIFQSYYKRTVAKKRSFTYWNPFLACCFETMFVVNYLFLFCDCRFSITLYIEFFGGIGYRAI